VSLLTELQNFRAGQHVHHRRLRSRLGWLLAVTAAVDVVATLAIWEIEHGVKGSDITDLWSAAFWTTAQLLTISSQMRNPLTAAGRALDIAIEFYSLVVVSSMAGMFAAFLTHKDHHDENMPG
jgi:hypothetical protein